MKRFKMFLETLFLTLSTSDDSVQSCEGKGSHQIFNFVLLKFLIPLILTLFLTGGATAEIVSDDFSRDNLNSEVWTFINPLGDASLSMTGTQAEISVPAGTSHDVWKSGNFAPRIMQPSNDTDFEIEVKFDSGVTEAYQMQGILAEEDSGNFLRFDFYSNGLKTRIFAASFADGVPAVRKDRSVLCASSSLRMRVKREGDLWTQSYSCDGAVWTESVRFSFPLSVNAVGVFAGNAHGTDSPAHTAVIDLFLNTASPETNEPPDAVFSADPLSGTVPLTVNFDASGSDDADGTVVSYTWDFGDGSTGAGAEAVHEYVLAGTYQVILTVTDNANAADTAACTVTVAAVPEPPVFAAHPADQTVEEGQTATFTATAEGTEPISYQWQKDGADIPGADSPAYTTPETVPEDSGTVFRCVAENAAGTAVSTGAALTVTEKENQAPEAVFSSDFLSGTAPLTVNFDASASADPDGTVVSYTWDFGDGGTGTGITAVREYTVAGVYSVTLTVTDDNGAADTSSCTVTVVSDISAIVSDDFNSSDLNGVWTFIDPVGDSSLSITGTHAEISVPAGAPHDVWTAGNFAPRIMQAAEDTDFEIEVKFDSGVTEAYQMQGIVAEEDSGNFLRFDFYSSGANPRIFAASFSDGVPAVRKDRSVLCASSSLRMRVKREGDLWTQSYSCDGETWTESVRFSFPLSVNSVGVFAGNAHGTDSPAHTAVIDLFLNTASPETNEPPDAVFSADPLSGTVPLTVNFDASGSDDADGTVVSYTWDFGDGSTGAGAEAVHEYVLAGTYQVILTVTDNANAADTAACTVTADDVPEPPAVTAHPADQTVTEGQTATFSVAVQGTEPISYQWQKDGADIPGADSPAYTTPETTPNDSGTLFRCVIENTAGSVTSNAALLTVTEKENLPPDALISADFLSGTAPLTVNFDASASADPDGTVVSYTWDFGDGSTGTDIAAVREYPLAGVYSVTLTVADDKGAEDTSSCTVTVTGGDLSGIASDDFNSFDLNGVWTFINPLGDASLSMTGTQAEIFVPAGTSHDVWKSGNFAPRIVQPSNDTDFEIEVKFDSGVTEAYQMQGILAEEDSGNFLRFDFYSSGANPRIFAASFSDGVPAVRKDRSVLCASSSLRMRVKREGDLWTQSYSCDGETWTESVRFSFPLSVNSVGVFAGNAHGTDSPAHTAVIDWFLNTASPETNQPPEAVFSADTLSGTAPLAVNFDASASGDPDGTLVSYTWDFGDGTAGTGETAVHEYILAGTYPVTLTVADNGNAADTAACTVTVTAVPEPPVFEAHPADQTVTEGQTATFTVAVQGTEPISYQWQKDGTDIPGANGSDYTTPETVPEDSGTVFRCAAENAAGTAVSTGAVLTVNIAGASDPVIDIWYGHYQVFGNIGIPQRWVNILGNVSDPDGIASLTYIFSGRSELPLSIGPDERRLEDEGDFNIEIDYADLNPGLNEVVIIAIDSNGNQTTEIVEVEYVSGNVCPENYTVDWGILQSIQEGGQVIDGLWRLEENTIRCVAPGYDRLVGIGDISWEDYEITVPITVHAVDFDSIWSPGVGVLMRWKGHYDWGGRPRSGWFPMGALGWYRWSKAGYGYLNLIGGGTELDISTGSVQVNVGICYIFKMRVETIFDQRSRYRLKVWKQGEPEPSEWDIVGDEDSSDLHNGSLLLLAYNVDASFGTVSVVPLNDTEPPVVNDISVACGDTWAAINWISDEPAVTTTLNYGETDAYESGSAEDNSSTTQHSITLTDLTPLTSYHYQIISMDEIGNIGNSEDFTFTTISDALFISDVTASVGNTQATVNWMTNRPATGSIAYGQSESYEIGSVDDDSLVMRHSITFTDLDPSQLYYYQIISTDENGNTVSSEDLNLFTEEDSSGIVSDNFNSGTLNWELWSFIDPMGDADLTLTETGAEISVPAGASHDIWKSGNFAPRIMQTVNDTNFEIEVKFDSGVNERYQLQGILAEEDGGNFLRFDFYSEGLKTRIFAASFVDEIPTARNNRSIPCASPLQMRINREEDLWTQSYSCDGGATWTTAVSFSFPLSVNTLGVFAGNAGGADAPAHTAVIDWFLNTDPAINLR